MNVGRIVCDLAKVSYSVNHEILLAKLHFPFCIQGAIASCFRSYPTNRRQILK
jgi:hypothetical protein